MSEFKRDARKERDNKARAEDDAFVITPETHGIGLLLLSPSRLGRAFTDQQPKCIERALAELNLSVNGLKAATTLMAKLDDDLAMVEAVADVLKGTYAGSEPHPTSEVAVAMIAKLREISD
jgi:hypothetical protein